MNNLLQFPLKKSQKKYLSITKEIDHVSLTFLENERRLSKHFSYDILVHQVHLLARRQKDFIKQPSDELNKKAHLLLSQLLNYTGNENELKDSHLHNQTKELISNYFTECDNFKW